jgi:predicted helicase
MSTKQRAELKKIRTFPSLIAYLRDEMGWPIETTDFDELTFDYTPEELGIDGASAAKIQEIKRLRPLSTSQPWGIFFVKFEPKKLPVVALRRILNRVVLKKRASANSSERSAWAADDLLFVSNYGEGDSRQISFAHFSHEGESSGLPTLKVLGWDSSDTPLHLDDIADKLTDNLAWPADDSDVEVWRKSWRSAFTLREGEVITTSMALAVRLAELARAIRDRIETVLEIETKDGPVTKLMKAFQEALVHDLDASRFADMYAQTIAYGLLSARITDPKSSTGDDFAAHMRTNPFLRDLMETFLQVGGRRGKTEGAAALDFDELGVSEVVKLLDDANMEAVVRDFGDRNPREDPVIHFYELFLSEYDAEQKAQRGVFYTPRPVVSYIVRSVHELLKSEFGLADGLADTATWGEMADRGAGLTIPEGVRPSEPFVTVLDPATGTGTFLVEAIDVIHDTLVEKWKRKGHGAKEALDHWNDYVPKHLLPRLHGYELLMAPYAIAHLKIGLKLHETGYRFESSERARVYLTNALEPASELAEAAAADLFEALGHEAQAVNAVKRNEHFTVVVGNPPYAQYSMNLGEVAKAHIERFRYANGQRIRARNALQLERNLNDDYVKFLGFASHLLPPRTGICGMITNRMYLESNSLVGLREWLATNFSRMWIVDLWGSSEESRRVPKLAGDENVFDILQGVAISFLTRRRLPEDAKGRVLARELIGSREQKYRLLDEDLALEEGGWEETGPGPERWLLHRSAADEPDAEGELTLAEVFPQFSTLVASNRDHLVVDCDREVVLQNIRDVQGFTGSNEEWSERFNITLKSGWNVTAAREKLGAIEDLEAHLEIIEYRPFDRRWIFFHPTLVWQTAPTVSKNVLADHANRVLVSLGKNRAETTNGQWVAGLLADKSVVSTRDNASGFPLYLHDAEGSLDLHQGAAQPNLSKAFLERLADRLGVPRTDPHGLPRGITPQEIFHYTYAVLYGPSYRERYSESLKNDFPRLPLTSSPELFHQLAQLGRELVGFHLVEAPAQQAVSAQYDRATETWRYEVTKDQRLPVTLSFNGPENPVVGKVGWSDDTVSIESVKPKKGAAEAKVAGTLGFHGVPEEVWNLHIGGYRVCEKWLKDRGPKKGEPGRTLTADDIAHYHRIVIALHETIRITREIDEVIDTHGGWPGAFRADKASTPTAVA